MAIVQSAIAGKGILYMTSVFFIFAVILLSIANGANDNFKGMATVWGSDVLSYKRALIIANLATFAGGTMALLLGSALLETFSGKGIVSGEVLQNSTFALAFALGAALAVILATVLHYPISTTHAIIGALAGAATAMPGAAPMFNLLVSKALLPLLFSPLIALGLTYILWSMRMMIAARVSMAVGGQTREVVGTFIENKAHIASGATVCFARGVNDTPKIASIMLLGNGFDISNAVIFASIAAFMVLGGGLFARDVATVMSKKVTGMSEAQGFTGNFVTALLVLFASKFGLGVSTTHVSVGSLFGIGAVNGSARLQMISQIVLAWVLTLPIAFLFAFSIVKLYGVN